MGQRRDRRDRSSQPEAWLLVACAMAALSATASVPPGDGEVPTGIEGTLVDRATGRPIEGGGIWDPQGEESPSLSDSDGRFTIPPMPAGHRLLRVEAIGYLDAELDLDPLARNVEPIRVALVAALPAIGHVFDLDDHPVADAELRLRPADERQPSLRARSNDQGLFTLPHVPAGRYTLEVRASGLTPLRVPGLDVTPTRPRTDLGVVWLSAGAQLFGRTLDAQGHPLADVTITAVPSKSRAAKKGPAEERTRETSSDQEGIFRFEGLSEDGRWTLRAQKPGWGTTLLEQVSPRRGDALTLTLRPEAVVEGRVLDASGQPIAEARIRLLSTTSKHSTAGARSTALASTTSDSVGFFHLQGLPGGEHRLEVVAEPGRRHPDYWSPIVLEAGESRWLDVELEGTLTLRGLITDPAGTPLADVWVAYEHGGAMEPSRVQTDSGGMFRLDSLSPGPIELGAWHPDYRPGEWQLNLEKDVAADELELVLEPLDGRTVAGMVLDARSGEPVAGLPLSLVDEDGRALAPPTPTDASGSFRWSHVEEGRYHIRARRTEGGRASWPLGVGDVDLAGLVLELEPPARISGRLIGLGLEGLAGVTVSARGAGRTRSTGPDWDGRFSFEGLDPGPWQITARSSADGRSATRRIELPPGGELELELDLSGGPVVEGTVTVEGEPAVGVAVQLLGGSTLSSTHTDHHGHYRLVAPAAGTYRLRTVAPTRRLESLEPIELPAAGPVDVELETTTRDPGR